MWKEKYAHIFKSNFFKLKIHFIKKKKVQGTQFSNMHGTIMYSNTRQELYLNLIINYVI